MIGVLLVDDHASTREPLAFMLDQEPDLAVVGQAGSLAQARSILGCLAADVAVVDLGLPDGAGEDLVAELRDARPCVPTLVLTYFGDRERVSHAVAAGAGGILHKSVSVEQVVAAIRRLHAGELLHSVHDVLDAARFVDRERIRDRAVRRSIDRLTPRELEILQALAEGLSDKEISGRFHLSAGTVRSHVTSILTKIGARSRLHALVTAVRYGLVTID